MNPKMTRIMIGLLLFVPMLLAGCLHDDSKVKIEEPTPTPIVFNLSVSISGSGNVASVPIGIACGTDCSEPLNAGTSITLTATPADSFVFSGWSGACSGTGTTCVLTMSADQSANATFNAAPVVQAPIDAYFVDATNGSDSNDGKSISTAWKSFTPLNLNQFLPGAVISLRRGEIWREPLRFISSGTASAPIVITAYGVGARPVISGGVRVPAGSVWISLGGDVWRIDLGPTSVFATGAPIVIRGPSGSNSTGFDMLTLAASQAALTADQFVTANASLTRQLIWQAPASLLPTNFDFEVSTIATPVKIQGNFVHLKNIDARVSTVESNAAIVSIEAADSMLESSEVRFSYYFGVRCNEVHRCVIRDVLAEKNRSTGIYVYGGLNNLANLSVSANDCIIENSISRNNGNKQPLASGDRGGIGIERGRRAIVRGNTVMNNGNLVAPETGGDHAISIFESPDVLVERNYVNGAATGGIVSGSDGPFSNGVIIRNNIITNWNMSESLVTAKASAISVLGYGNDAAAGRHIIDNNTIFSDGGVASRWLVGISVQMSSFSYILNDLRVRNNIAYIRNNTNVATAALRVNKPMSQLLNPIINNNNVIVEAVTGSAYEVFGVDYATAALFSSGTGGLHQTVGVWQDMNPGFVVALPIMPADFALAPTSAMRDQGVNVGTTTDFFSQPFVGLPDAGAIEFIP